MTPTVLPAPGRCDSRPKVNAADPDAFHFFGDVQQTLDDLQGQIDDRASVEDVQSLSALVADKADSSAVDEVEQDLGTLTSQIDDFTQKVNDLAARVGTVDLSGVQDILETYSAS
jgi:hypothetical protein